MQIGEKIKQRRLELQWTQRDLAEKMGYRNNSTITRIEKCEVNLPKSRIEKFAKVLGVTVAYLMNYEETQKKNDAITDNEWQMGLGLRIKTARKAKGLTQEELGNILGLQKSAIAKYENGRIVNIKRSTLKKIAEVLDIQPFELIYGSDLAEVQKKNDSIEEIVLRMQNDNIFFNAVITLYKMDTNKLSNLLALFK